MGHRVTMLLPYREEPECLDIIRRIADRWGGVTLSDAAGTWLSDHEDMVSDKLVRVECSVGSWDDDMQGWWQDLARHCRKLWDEDCIYLSVVPETAVLVYETEDEDFLIGE